MALRKEITHRITSLLKQNPQGLSITEIVEKSGLNRNTAGRYLDNLLVSGQVEMRHFGMAKIYSLSCRLPASSVLALSSEFVIQLDASLRILFLNQPFLDLLKQSEKEIVGKNIEFSAIPLFFDETFPRVLAWIHSGLAGEESRGEIWIPSQDLIFSWRIAPAVLSSGQKGVSVIFEDITARRHNEELLRESEERFRTLVNNANDMITLHGFGPDGLPGRYLEVNDEACRRLRYTREQLLTMSPKDIIAPECAGRMGQNAKKLKKAGHITFEMVHLTRDGQRIPVEINAHVFEFRGEPVVLALVRDITERKQAENQLQLMKISIESAYDEVFWMDMEAGFHYVNDAACRATGYSPEEFYAMKVYTLDPDFSPARWEESIADLRKNKKQFFQTRHRRKDGVILDVEISSVYVTRSGKEYVFCFVRDITKRVAAEREQQQSQENNRFIAEHCVDIIHRLTPDCICTYTSPSVTSLLGYRTEEVLGKPVLAMVHPDDLPGVRENLSTISRTGQDTITTTFRFRHKEGHYLWFESTTRIVRDASGKIKEFLSISRDISERKDGQ
jgi:PAS domain S-box-containing protein